jgi:hypothetical protein
MKKIPITLDQNNVRLLVDKLQHHSYIVPSAEFKIRIPAANWKENKYSDILYDIDNSKLTNNRKVRDMILNKILSIYHREP